MDIVDYWLSDSSKTLFDYRILLSSINNPYFDTKHSIVSRKFDFSKINRCVSDENGRGRFSDPSPWNYGIELGTFFGNQGQIGQPLSEEISLLKCSSRSKLKILGLYIYKCINRFNTANYTQSIPDLLYNIVCFNYSPFFTIVTGLLSFLSFQSIGRVDY